MKVAIVAGEKSGDYLGAELMKALCERYPNAEFVGICGPLMQAQGGKSLADMDKLSIFGLDGLFLALPELISIRRNLFKYFIEWQADVFIGIDAPDFNHGLERKLKEQGIPAVHYVSPTVWAWRGGRIKKIKKSIDLMLTLFPFEVTYYNQHDTPVAYVGHPLAQQIAEWRVDDIFTRSVDVGSNKLIAILPGSRMSEVSRLAPIMFEGASRLAKKFPNLKFVVPAANKKLLEYLKELDQYDKNLIQIIDGHSRDVLALCDLVILASGTAALEAALFAKPMVVMYKVSWLSAFVFKHSITVENYSMPNHLTDPPAVKELIQSEATVGNLVAEVFKLLTDELYYQTMQSALSEITPKLSVNSGKLACDAIATMFVSRESLLTDAIENNKEL